MKKLLLILLLFVSISLSAATYADHLSWVRETSQSAGQILSWSTVYNAWVNSTSADIILDSLNARTANITEDITLGNDALNTSGTINWIASDNDQGTMAINTSDGFDVSGFGGGFDIDGDFTAGTVTSDAGVAGTTGTFSSNIRIANDTYFQARNNADDAWDGLLKYNTSDEIDVAQQLNTGMRIFTANSGMVNAIWQNVTSDCT